MANNNGIRKSNFVAKTTIPNDATFDFVSGGANYKMTIANMLTAFGTTGSVENVGLNTDTQILDDQGSVKGIRRINDGFGITTSIDGNNSLSIAIDYSFPPTGVQLVNDVAASAVEWRSLVAGTGMTVVGTDDTITITNTAPLPTFCVTVLTKADLPDAVAGVRTLANDTVYLIGGDIDIDADRIVLGNNCNLIGFGTDVSTITSTTTGALFTATAGKTFYLHALAVTCASGTVFDLTGNGSTDSAFLKEFQVTSATGLGTVNGWYSFFWEKGAGVSFTSPLTFSNACKIAIFDLVSFITGYTTAVDLGTATFDTASFNRCGFSYASATQHINIAASSANINSGKRGRFIGNSFASIATVVNGYATGDLRWNSSDNLNLARTTKNAQGYSHSSQTTTVSVTGTKYLMSLATSFVSSHSEQFTLTTAGRMTYSGQESAEFLVSALISGTVASGTDTMSFYIAKNGTFITETKATREFTSTATGFITASGIVDLANGDYIEVYLANDTGTANWTNKSLNLIAGEV